MSGYASPGFRPAGYPRWAHTREPWIDFPKVSLHDHLDGSLRPETLIELAAAHGVALPHDDPETLARWFIGDVAEPVVTDWEEKFGLTTAVMQTEAALVRIAREWVIEAAADGVVYGEVRWAPEKHTLGALPLRVAVEAVAAGLREGEDTVAVAGGRIRARQLLCGMRTSARSAEIARLAVDTYGEWGDSVAGYDIAGLETGFPVRAHLDAIDALERAGVPYTIHTGEGDGEHSVWETVHLAHALRLGHGVRVIEDVRLNGRPLDVRTAVRDVAAARAAGAAELTLGRTAQWVIDRRIPLEVCVSSNAMAVLDGIENHPIDLLRELGFTLTINPDNRLISMVCISAEFRRIQEWFGWGVPEFQAVELAGVEAAFLSGPEKTALAADVRAAIAAFTPAAPHPAP